MSGDLPLDSSAQGFKTLAESRESHNDSFVSRPSGGDPADSFLFPEIFKSCDLVVRFLCIGSKGVGKTTFFARVLHTSSDTFPYSSTTALHNDIVGDSPTGKQFCEPTSDGLLKRLVQTHLQASAWNGPHPTAATANAAAADDQEATGLLDKPGKNNAKGKNRGRSRGESAAPEKVSTLTAVAVKPPARQAVVVLIVFDLTSRKSYLWARKRIDMLQRDYPDLPVVTIANKVDLHPIFATDMKPSHERRASPIGLAPVSHEREEKEEEKAEPEQPSAGQPEGAIELTALSPNAPAASSAPTSTSTAASASPQATDAAAVSIAIDLLSAATATTATTATADQLSRTTEHSRPMETAAETPEAAAAASHETKAQPTSSATGKPTNPKWVTVEELDALHAIAPVLCLSLLHQSGNLTELIKLHDRHKWNVRDKDLRTALRQLQQTVWSEFLERTHARARPCYIPDCHWCLQQTNWHTDASKAVRVKLDEAKLTTKASIARELQPGTESELVFVVNEMVSFYNTVGQSPSSWNEWAHEYATPSLRLRFDV